MNLLKSSFRQIAYSVRQSGKDLGKLRHTLTGHNKSHPISNIRTSLNILHNKYQNQCFKRQWRDYIPGFIRNGKFLNEDKQHDLLSFKNIQQGVIITPTQKYLFKAKIPPTEKVLFL
jgi:hypothetical protein